MGNPKDARTEASPARRVGLVAQDGTPYGPEYLCLARGEEVPRAETFAPDPRGENPQN